jgi:cytochrome b pre-mRNA-processing protein 3
MRLSAIFRRRPETLRATDLYLAIVAQARQSEFYEVLGVPDTLDGRFEMIVVHAVMVLRRLRVTGSEGKAIAQALFDQMFADMDRNLRELGAGDLGVGRRVKRMATAFYGRAENYEKGLDGPKGELEDAITRNVYGTVSASARQASNMASYIRREMASLSKLDGKDLLAGKVSFGIPPCVETSR